VNFNKHYNLSGQHAFLSASKWHWINYDEDHLLAAYSTWRAAARGTELHEFAATAIRLKQKLADTGQTLNMYVNDAIGYRMTPEQILYYSDNCFGTADAISFDGKNLRIHDLKTGVNPAHMEQLMVYTALFCLEYGKRPNDIDVCLRIYQNDQIVEYLPDVDEIAPIIDKIITFDKLLDRVRYEEA